MTTERGTYFRLLQYIDASVTNGPSLYQGDLLICVKTTDQFVYFSPIWDFDTQIEFSASFVSDWVERIDAPYYLTEHKENYIVMLVTSLFIDHNHYTIISGRRNESKMFFEKGLRCIITHTYVDKKDYYDLEVLGAPDLAIKKVHFSNFVVIPEHGKPDIIFEDDDKTVMGPSGPKGPSGWSV